MSSEESSNTSNHISTLGILDISHPYGFIQPKKRINEGEDIPAFLVSKGYADIMTFLMQLNRAMFPSYIDQDGHKSSQIWEIGSSKVELSKTVLSLRGLIAKLESFIQEAPPDTGPRRFGNISFRRWYEIVGDRTFDLLEEFLPHSIFEFDNTNPGAPGPRAEVEAYFVGSFGSSQRLDYGTGHELSFLAFLGCIWKLGGFEKSELGVEERGIVIGVIEPYLNLCRKLIKIYTLEPAGSHGVWGLDDHFFIPYIFGSAQLSPAVRDSDPIPLQGSGLNVPDAPGVAKPTVVAAERDRNMYFSAVGFIQDVKRGPFWEHSPMLFDISGVRAGWAKINKGMLKMYNAEVLSKFPVVQHFPFGSLFSFDCDPNARAPDVFAHTSSHLASAGDGLLTSTGPGVIQSSETPLAVPTVPEPEAATAAPWASAQSNPPPRDSTGGTRVPGTTSQSDARLRGPMAGTKAPWSSSASTRRPPPPPPPTQISTTRAPWATADAGRPRAELPMRVPGTQPSRPKEDSA